MAAVAAHKGIKVGTMGVQIHRQTMEGAPWQTTFAIELDLGTGLNRREQAILYNSARRCEVHKLLTGEMQFEYSIQRATKPKNERGQDLQ
jgi:hypothetical protein